MYEQELEIGKKAVIEAIRITKAIQRELAGTDSITKADKSPVTIADFAAQAIVCYHLNKHFPEIPIVGEEDSADLQKPEHAKILEQILRFIDADPDIRQCLTKDNLFDSIDLGGGKPDKKIFWTLDPVDGTKGFLRGEQYAIALALIVDGEVKLGISGCPNLELPDQTSESGFLAYAVKEEGAYLYNVETSEVSKITVSDITDSREMRFVESYVSGHSNQGLQADIAKELEIRRESVRLDSQVKYAILASGNAEIYLRIPNPKTPDYKEKIWDHAAGSIVVQEAGGIVTDIYGKSLDFSTGKTLKDNSGIVGSVPSVHGQIIKIIDQLK